MIRKNIKTLGLIICVLLFGQKIHSSNHKIISGLAGLTVALGVGFYTYNKTEPTETESKWTKPVLYGALTGLTMFCLSYGLLEKFNKKADTTSNTPASSSPTKSPQELIETFNKNPREHDVFITVVEGDMVQQQFKDPTTSAITNAANTGLAGGSGIDGAIHAVAGQGHLEKANKKNKVKNYIPEVGAVITHAQDLEKNVGYIIHAVGPMGEYPEKLTTTYKETLSCADLDTQHGKVKNGLEFQKSLPVSSTDKPWNGLTTIAIPPISTGIFGYDIKKATPVAIATTLNYLAHHPKSNLEEVRFVDFDQTKPSKGYPTYIQALEEHCKNGILEKVTDLKTIDAARWTALTKSSCSNPPMVFKLAGKK